MSLGRPLAVTAVAARTAAGASAEQTATSIRANIVRLREDPIYLTLPRDPEGERAPARTARVDGVDPALDGSDRLFALLEPVLGSLLESAEPVRRAALLVALPAPDAVTDGWALDAFAPELARRLAISFATVQASRAGHAGVHALLAEASALMARGAADRCVIAAVDSYLTPARLALYDDAERVRSPRNADGFFPGEAAAAILVEGERRGEARAAELHVVGLGAGSEPETVRGEKPSTGRGLADALRGAIGDGSPRWAVSDFNGETYRAYEWGLVQARLGDRLQALAAHSIPARNTGDVGAASGAVQIALAAAAFRRGWAPADEALLWAGSDGGERAAALVVKP